MKTPGFNVIYAVTKMRDKFEELKTKFAAVESATSYGDIVDTITAYRRVFFDFSTSFRKYAGSMRIDVTESKEFLNVVSGKDYSAAVILYAITDVMPGILDNYTMLSNGNGDYWGDRNLYLQDFREFHNMIEWYFKTDLDECSVLSIILNTKLSVLLKVPEDKENEPAIIVRAFKTKNDYEKVIGRHRDAYNEWMSTGKPVEESDNRAVYWYSEFTKLPTEKKYFTYLHENK